MFIDVISNMMGYSNIDLRGFEITNAIIGCSWEWV